MQTLSESELLILILVFFATSFVSVVTGSTSLITVPALLQCGIAPGTALATNMLALTCMSVGGTLPFLRSSALEEPRLPRLAALTFVGSILGAVLVPAVPADAIPIFVSLAMVGMMTFALLYRDIGVSTLPPSRSRQSVGWGLTFLLAGYGGFFSGGYVTLLTAAYVATFGYSFVQAVAVTKLLNVVSSMTATCLFMWLGLIDYQLGVLLGLTMFVGALLGGRLAIRLGERWLRRIFLAAVWALAMKMLVFDTRRR